jgi:hypothetical protein
MNNRISRLHLSGHRQAGLSSGWEDYMYTDMSQPEGSTYVQPNISYSDTSGSSGYSDAGTSSFFGGLLNTVSQLGTTYLQTSAAQETAAQALARQRAGMTTQVAPNGQIIQTSAPLQVAGVSISSLLQNPLVLLGGGFLLYKLLKKKGN